jgi:hypothetical protein
MEKYLIYEKGKFDINTKDLDDISKSINLKYDKNDPVFCSECNKEYLYKNLQKHKKSKTHLKNLKKS